jgi:hypothetical protein
MLWQILALLVLLPAPTALQMDVNAKELMNYSNMTVSTGDSFSLKALGTWTDWYIDTDADGYSNALVDLQKKNLRYPDALFFTLIACVDDGGPEDTHKCEAAGTSSTWVVPTAGELYFFANDVPSMYWNNKGAVRLTINQE